ncbi:MAG: 30S ribosomal protein THX [Bacteroidales bacterium]
MGKGDIKTRRGKLFKGSFGKLRPRRKGKRPLNVTPHAHPMQKEPRKKPPG